MKFGRKIRKIRKMVQICNLENGKNCFTCATSLCLVLFGYAFLLAISCFYNIFPVFHFNKIFHIHFCQIQYHLYAKLSAFSFVTVLLNLKLNCILTVCSSTHCTLITLIKSNFINVHILKKVEKSWEMSAVAHNTLRMQTALIFEWGQFTL